MLEALLLFPLCDYFGFVARDPLLQTYSYIICFSALVRLYPLLGNLEVI